jgi:hypothetical protein
VAGLVRALREAGAQDQVSALLRRDPAAHVSLESPYGVADLLDALWEVGAQDQVSALLRRDPGAHVSLGYPGGVADLLDALREAGAQDQAAALAARAVAHVSLDRPSGVAWLLRAAGGGRAGPGRRADSPVAGGRHVQALHRTAGLCGSVPFRMGVRWQPKCSMELGRPGLIVCFTVAEEETKQPLRQ